MLGQIKAQIKTVDNPQYTRNDFGPITEIAGRVLQVVDRNSRGDCLCMVDQKYLVDIDYRDIKQNG